MRVELLKFFTTIVAALLGGWLAIQQVTHEYRLATEREARAELVKRFVNDTDDLNDVFRAVAFLVRTGMLGDSDGRLRQEVQKHFAQPIEEIVLSSIMVRPSAAAAQSAAGQAAPPAPLPQATPPGTPAAEAEARRTPSPIVPQRTQGSVLVTRVDQLNDSTPSVRRGTAQAFVDVLRGTVAIEAEEQKRLAEALVDMLSTARLRGLSAEGRLNVIYVLSEVPDPRWAAWPDVAGTLRGRLEELEDRRRNRQTLIGTETLGRLNILRQSLGMPTLAALPG